MRKFTSIFYFITGVTSLTILFLLIASTEDICALDEIFTSSILSFLAGASIISGLYGLINKK